jgi:outer membrane protein assembly factor BamE (lipoprotein component of BamABCDE complex)
MKRQILGTAITVAALSGCVTVGKDFKSDVSWIKEGHTKQSDVSLVLGDPRSVGNSSGTPTWTYGYYQYRMLGDSASKELKFYWKKDGTVDQFSFNSSFADDISKAGLQPTRTSPGGSSRRHESEF